ncbi:PilZ domain-containing protein [Bradyrhizobium sp. AUGA SZCCT0182]|uniref:PilZ domain-containing protein n=1 Tax=Bradyrhizobium sp. AUGA SZCCT0182 TaxID=2807667 RepID=UPI0028A05FE1|nr:PilZ domain-containing protein [Bradyrhizobium sp. AUGA SZCCT0182]
MARIAIALEADASWRSPILTYRIVRTKGRFMKTGIIEFSGRAIACLIRNQSETGAGLEVVSPVGIPAQFTLLIAADRIRCTVIWRTEKLIGVKFQEYLEESQKRFGRHQ